MSLWKKGRIVDIRHVEGKMEVEEYIYTPGIAGLELAKALIEGKILGVKCDGKVYIPAKTFCPDFTRGELVEVEGSWTIETYTIIYEDMYGRKLEKPQIIALLKLENVEGGLIHYVNVDPKTIRVGLKVKPVFKPREERKGLLTDIIYFTVEH